MSSQVSTRSIYKAVASEREIDKRQEQEQEEREEDASRSSCRGCSDLWDWAFGRETTNAGDRLDLEPAIINLCMSMLDGLCHHYHHSPCDQTCLPTTNGQDV